MKNKYQLALVGISISAVSTSAFVGCGGLVAETETRAVTDAGRDAVSDTAIDAGPLPLGFFSLRQSVYVDGFPDPKPRYGYQADGYLLSKPWTGRPDATCTTTRVGTCVINVCDYPIGTTGDIGAPFADSINVGPLRMASPTHAVVVPFVREGDAGSSYSGGGSDQFFKAGETITISGGGSAGYPEFSQAVIAPNDIVITAPDCSGPGGCPYLDRKLDAVVTWTGAGVGSVVALLTSTSEKRVVNASCTFDAASGAARIPSAILAQVESGGGATFFPISEVHFSVGEADTTFVVMGSSGDASFRLK